MEQQLKINNNYFATSEGKIYNTATGKLNEGGYNRRYLRCKINGKGYNIHRLIAETFIPNPDNKPQVNHVDGNKHNNSVSNLEWVTAYENNLHARQSGLALGPKSGEASNCSKLDDTTIQFIKSIHKPFNKQFGTRALAKKYGVNECWLSDILNSQSKRQIEWN
jgi:hypothetical protein